MIKSSKTGKNYKQVLGAWGERQAEAFLMERGLVLVTRNYRTPYGEIDLVMQSGDQLVFIEVKTRSSINSNPPEEAVTARKQEHMLLSAQQYLEDHPDANPDWRIDVISIRGRRANRPVEIMWFEDALA